ncbi:hypothetical protein QQ008_23095 [Fulvivirgaceae bacterium BMA10]|uniref:Uncharacterized protein n=1 Tax=Splendidivirga corallicola TaxID=3051826 RepID=A0ABT8KV82_9BACT|nr:hypothetical protein [Fulvivirgaceae bacterium BMA10]
MTLNSLKSTWKQLKLQNSFDVIDQDEVLRIIETTETVAINKTRRLLTNSAMFLILMICFHGG